VSLSTVDWPGKATCTVFLRGCPLKCSYCQNETIQEGENWKDIDEIMELITTSMPFISAVVFSGGEPTLQKNALIALTKKVKGLGLLVGLQTNGLFSETLDCLIKEKLVDRIALDFKTSWESYHNVIEGYPLPLKKKYQDNAINSVKICRRALRNNELLDFQVVFTVFEGNEDEIISISQKMGKSEIVLQQGEHKLNVLDPESRKLVDGKYVRRKRILQEYKPPLSLEDLKRLANKLGKTVRIRVRGEGEITYFMKVIGVVGMPASGKGEFARIASDMGIPVIVMGDMIRIAVKAAGLEPTDTNFGSMASRLRTERGMDAIGQLCVPEVERQTAPLVLIDGIRGDSEVNLFRKVFPRFTLISIDSSFENRLSRVAARGRSDDFQTADELHNRDERELGWGLGKALMQADMHVKNNGTLDEFSVAVHKLLNEIRSDP
jgi:pyruvate formate lyase activating enzyme